jgi:hypothetical protein
MHSTQIKIIKCARFFREDFGTNYKFKKQEISDRFLRMMHSEDEQILNKKC